MLRARGLSSDAVELSTAHIGQLADALRGRLLRQGDDGYERARRIWNAMIDRRPALIAQCTGAADVIRCVRFARDHDLLVSVRGGGHNISGNAVCDDALMIDLSAMQSVRVDPIARVVRAEPGVVWRTLDRETHAFGMATPGGIVASTGIAGLTLGGGQGWLTGKYGLTVDNLLSADVVTVDGELLHASSSDNPDLFWGLRGAGANLGIVTSFEYRAHPVATVVGGMVVHAVEAAPKVLRFYREFAAAQPDELTTYAVLLTTPDGVPVVALVCCYVGASDAALRTLEPLRRYGKPIADTIAQISHPAMQDIITAANPPGRLGYWKSGLTVELSDALIDGLIDQATRVPSPYTAIAIADCHGAYSRVSSTETAYFHRAARFDVAILSSWTEASDSARNVAWTRDCFGAIESELTAGVYVNDLGDEGAERVKSAYGDNFERLVILKNRYDPTNFLRLNQNIPPSPASHSRRH